MTFNRFQPAASHRHGGPVGPRCRGGASSLLRLTSPVTPRLPAPVDVADWINRATEVLTVTGPLSDARFGASA